MKRLRAVWVRFVEILSCRDFEYAELQGAGVALIWAVCLAWYASFGDAHDAEIAGLHPWIWAFIFAAIGSSQLSGLLTLNYPLRRSSSFAATMVWLFVAAAFGGDWRALLCAMSFAISIASAWGYVRIGRARAMAAERIRQIQAFRS